MELALFYTQRKKLIYFTILYCDVKSARFYKILLDFKIWYCNMYNIDIVIDDIVEVTTYIIDVLVVTILL